MKKLASLAAALALGANFRMSRSPYDKCTPVGTSAAISFKIEILHGIAPVAGAFVLLFALERLFFPKSP